jgi:hypothetical protein
VPAETGDADDGGDKVEDAGYFLDRNHLPKVDLLLVVGNQPDDGTPYKAGKFVQSLQFAKFPFEPFRMAEEFGDEFAPPQIAQEILGVIHSLQIPLLAFPMFMAELAQWILLLPNRESLFWADAPCEPSCLSRPDYTPKVPERKTDRCRSQKFRK